MLAEILQLVYEIISPKVFRKTSANSQVNTMSNHLEVFCQKGVFKNFSKLTEKHLCQTLFFNKIAGWKFVTLLIKRPQYRCFPVSFVNFLKTPSL